MSEWAGAMHKLHGSRNSTRLPTLAASEIGTFAFCPQAWYLQRVGTPVTSSAEQRRHFGSDLHRKIGRQTDFLRVARIAQTILLLVIALGLIALVALALNG